MRARSPYKNIVDALHRALECSLNPAPDSRDAKSWYQDLTRNVKVYGREGQSSRARGEPVRRVEQGAGPLFSARAACDSAH
jgi:hypothetical protein